MKPTIFVQIPAYRDPETLPTIRDAIAKAAFPERIHFGVCWQYVPGVDEHMLPATEIPSSVRLLSVRAEESKGVCWARHLVQSLYDGEDYTLSIDSHSRFSQNWDELLIEELARCDSHRPIISTYPARYTLEDGIETNPLASFMLLKEMVKGLPRFKTQMLAKKPNQPLRGLFVAAGFHFGAGQLIADAPVDPYLYFDQEEIALNTKLWCHGYDIFSPTDAFVFHLYAEDHDAALRPLHWDNNASWVSLDNCGNERLHYLLANKPVSKPDFLKEINYYGLGEVRQLDAFTQLSGIDFKAGTARSDAYDGSFLSQLNPDQELSLQTQDGAVV